MKRRIRLDLLSLESRLVPATFGIPWADARHLTVSFAPDQTAISGSTSNLFQTLNSQAGTSVWQRDILRALQSWASVTNIDVGLVSDAGLAFGSNAIGSAGRVAGDIRIGATDLAANVLAIGLPPDPYFADSWSGEVIYNSNNELDPDHHTLYSVFLHEFGHAFGVDEIDTPGSAMYNAPASAVTKLGAVDVATIQDMYGVRQPDMYDADAANNTIWTATRIISVSPPGGHGRGQNTQSKSAPVVFFGDVTTNSDVDFYRLDVPLGYNGSATYRVQTRGISLMNPKVSVYNTAGTLVSQQTSTQLGGGYVEIKIPRVFSGSRYYLKIEGATPDVFGIGRYSAAVTYDAAVSPAMLAGLPMVMTGPFDGLDSCEINTILTHSGDHCFFPDNGTNDTIADADPLRSTTARGVYSTTGTLQSASDIDIYRIKTPNQTTPLTLTITTRATSVNGIVPKAELVNGAGQVIAAMVLANGDGRFTIQATNLSPTGAYYVRVTGMTAGQIGNYTVTAYTSAPAVTPTEFETVSVSTQTVDTLVVLQSQVFHFLLSVSGASDDAIRMTIESNGSIVYDVTVKSGSAASARAVLLKPGNYTVRYSRVGSGVTPLTARLNGAVISDPIGPLPQDTTANNAANGGDLASYYFASLKRLRKFLETKANA
ncbi:MAG: matrixin family metalloprotease [Gemmataceae bacterium]|nr:matrixin family metalloprotease [Gemmataceae bacterium]